MVVFTFLNFFNYFCISPSPDGVYVKSGISSVGSVVVTGPSFLYYVRPALPMFYFIHRCKAYLISF